MNYVKIMKKSRLIKIIQEEVKKLQEQESFDCTDNQAYPEFLLSDEELAAGITGTTFAGFCCDENATTFGWGCASANCAGGVGSGGFSPDYPGQPNAVVAYIAACGTEGAACNPALCCGDGPNTMEGGTFNPSDFPGCPAQPEVGGLCDDLESYVSTTYGIETWEFCSKCETGSYTDAECACCTPPTGGDDVATPDRGEKPKDPQISKDPQKDRMKKLAGIPDKPKR